MELIKSNKLNFAAYLEDISFLEADTVKPASSFGEDLDAFYAGGGIQGALLPWDRTHETIQFSPGELTIWAGESSSGKSQVTGQAILWWLRDTKAVIASMEMQPWQTVRRMANQAAGCEASRDFAHRFLEWTDNRLWIYDQVDSVAVEKILGMAHWSINELGVADVVIDSLTKCGLSRDDYSAQAKFVDKLQWIAKRYNCRIHLVCHMRKPPQGHRSGKHDVRGAAEITDLADNVLVISRNKIKEAEEEKMRRGRTHDPERLQEPDTFLEVAKNRKTGEEKTFGLWFNKESNQFVTRTDRRPIPFGLRG